MGALAAAFVLALVLNPRVRVRPNAYLVILSLLALLALASSLRFESGLGAMIRCARLVLFVATLWLLSGWWRGDLRFLNFHLRALSVVLLSVLAGLVISPGGAFSGRTAAWSARSGRSRRPRSASTAPWRSDSSSCSGSRDGSTVSA